MQCELYANESGITGNLVSPVYRGKAIFYFPVQTILNQKEKGIVGMENYKKYSVGYFLPPERCMEWTKKDHVEKAPVWCSVDLRDGNQALVIPMSLEEKLEFFEHLVKIGFKEIEIGFPAASETEYEFCRTLIEKNMIPDDVTIQVLTQSREHIIKKTFEALKGVKNAIVHLYNSTSVAQREQVFRKSKEEIIKIATDGAELLNQYREKYKGESNFRFEYSPESFTGTEMEFARDICNAVIDIWKPTPDDKVIINLPVTVEVSMPHVYAQQIEYMCKAMHNRENLIVSLHPHNDRGCAVADCEMGLLAGADRIEGTCFGNGERTGNADIVTVAMNMFSQGVDPMLDFSDMPTLVELYERVTRMTVSPRSPYSGSLVFAAFSGSHQDAINKGHQYMKESGTPYWEIPYLPIDPADVGRQYEPIVRINSQSGKGGAAFVMHNNFGYDLPKRMHREFYNLVQAECEKLGRELIPAEVLKVFESNYLNIKQKYELVSHKVYEESENGKQYVHFKGRMMIDGNTEVKLKGVGNGPIDAFFRALKPINMDKYRFVNYSQHAFSEGSDSKAVSYIELKKPNGKNIFGVGIDSNVNFASILGVLNAINRAELEAE